MVQYLHADAAPTTMSEAEEASAHACLISHGNLHGRSNVAADGDNTQVAMTGSCGRPAPKDYALLFVGVCIGLFLGQHASSTASANQMPSSGRPSVGPIASPIPPLNELIEGNDILGDVSWMLDFSIVDFPKGGTTW